MWRRETRNVYKVFKIQLHNRAVQQHNDVLCFVFFYFFPNSFLNSDCFFEHTKLIFLESYLLKSQDHITE